MIGIRTQFYSVDSEKNTVASKLPALWNSFLQRLQEISNTVGGKCYGALYRVEKHDDKLNYFAAIEVHDTCSIPAGMEVLVLPESRYAQFTHRGLVERLDDTVDYVYSNWLLGSDHQHSYVPDLEIYGPEYHPTSSSTVIRYAIPLV